VIRKRTLSLFCVLILSTGRTGFSSEAQKTIKFAVLGDVHVGLRGEDHGFKMTGSSERIFEIAVEQLNKMPDLSFVVFDGDLVVDGESFNLARFKEIADRLHCPYYVVLGNHDQPVIPSADAWGPGVRAFYPGETKAGVAAMFRGHGFSSDGRTWWSADFAGIHLVGLDSVQIKTWGGVLPWQELDWLKKDLTASRAKPTLVFLHHNLVESYPEYKLWPEFLVSNRAEVKAVLASFPQVKAVISAHYHFSDYHTESGVHYFTTSSVNTYPCRFSVFEMMPASLRLRVHDIVQPDERHDEADSIRWRAKEELLKAEDWVRSITQGQKEMGKPSDADSVKARLWEMFDANSESPALPLR